MIGARVEPESAQLFRYFLGFVPGEAINDNRFPAVFFEKTDQFRECFFLFDDPYVEIFSVETGYEYPGVGNVQVFKNIPSHFFGRGRGQRDQRGLWIQAFQNAQIAVIGTEIMAPFRDAVRLIHRDQGYGNTVQKILESHGGETLGRDIENFDVAFTGAPHHIVDLLVRLAGIDEVGFDAVGFQPVDLILHQGDER